MASSNDPVYLTIQSQCILVNGILDEYTSSRITFTHTISFEMITIHNNTVKKIKLDFDKMLNAIQATPSNSCAKTRDYSQSFIIVKHGSCPNMSNWLYVPTTLIDADYPKNEIFAYLCNYSDVNIPIQEFDCFTLVYELGTRSEHENFLKLEIFMNYKGLPSFYAEVIRLHKATSNAQGIDITFKKEYSISSRGSLLLDILWHYNLQLDKYPFLFILRSRFTKLGIIIKEVSSRGILLLNLSDSYVFLGQRFIQLVLPLPYIFENGSCNYINHKNYIASNLSVEYLNKPRKLKP